VKKKKKLLFFFTDELYPRCQGLDVSFTIQCLLNLTQTVCWSCNCHCTGNTTERRESHSCFVL